MDLHIFIGNSISLPGQLHKEPGSQNHKQQKGIDSQSGGHSYSINRVGSTVTSEGKQSQASHPVLGLWPARFGNPGLIEASSSPLLCFWNKLSPDHLSSGSPYVSLPPCHYELHSIGSTTCWASSLLAHLLQSPYVTNENPPLPPSPLLIFLPSP